MMIPPSWAQLGQTFSSFRAAYNSSHCKWQQMGKMQDREAAIFISFASVTKKSLFVV